MDIIFGIVYFLILCKYVYIFGAWGSVVIKALRY
jgi:hypothetical protein